MGCGWRLGLDSLHPAPDSGVWEAPRRPSSVHHQREESFVTAALVGRDYEHKKPVVPLCPPSWACAGSSGAHVGVCVRARTGVYTHMPFVCSQGPTQ